MENTKKSHVVVFHNDKDELTAKDREKLRKQLSGVEDEEEEPEESTNPTGDTENNTKGTVSRKETGKFTEIELEGHSEQILGQIANSDINFGLQDKN
jgi:hypothetical protein